MQINKTTKKHQKDNVNNTLTRWKNNNENDTDKTNVTTEKKKISTPKKLGRVVWPESTLILENVFAFVVMILFAACVCPRYK